MAEFISEGKRRKAAYDKAQKDKPGDGFNAFGHPVPLHRRAAAMQHCHMMNLEMQASWDLVGKMANCVERDQPYEAIQEGCVHLDLLGSYRVLAALCTAEPR